uniref:Uncharacterized protein n=1 Tax=viral metagenome TaxID=1070528 RepID=A0A6M3L2Q8_9ZZZZ
MAHCPKYPAALIAVVCRAAERGVCWERIARRSGLTFREVRDIVQGSIRGALASPVGPGELCVDDPQRMDLEIGLDLRPPEWRRYLRLVQRRREAEKDLIQKTGNA